MTVQLWNCGISYAADLDAIIAKSGLISRYR